jgi:pimeloyl-ACP methyl ester carboxylesterase
MSRHTTKRRVVVVRGLTFRATVSTKAEPASSAFVLIHGIGVSHRYFSRLHRHLGRTHTVASIDLPGFGGVPKPPLDPDVPAMAAALADAIAALDLGRVVLVGHSMGVQWAVETALQRPELVSVVVAIGPVADVEHRTAAAQGRSLMIDTLGEPPGVNAIVFVEYMRCGIRWYLRQLRHMLAYATEERVTQLSVPLLIIRGADDPIAGLRWCRLLRRQAPDASLVLVPGHHHLVQQSAPAAVASAMLAHQVVRRAAR